MSLILQGKVETIIPRTKEKSNEVFSRVYQIKVVQNGGFVKLINVDDFDLNRKISIGDTVNLPVYCDIWQPQDKNGKFKSPVLQYHAIKEDDAKLFTPTKNIRL